jgi:hypothetical protein
MGEVENLEGRRAEEVGEAARRIWMTRRRRRRRPDERGGGGGRREGGGGFRVAGAGEAGHRLYSQEDGLGGSVAGNGPPAQVCFTESPINGSRRRFLLIFF